MKKGDDVEWKYGQGKAEGTVVEVKKETVTRTTKGAKVTRKGTAEDPALIIKGEKGATVLKREHEVKKK